jgi:polyhydroxyalkanoate synthesis regulator phasin
MATKKNLSATKEKVSKVINQAKESLKILETLERETLAKAKSFVKIPSAADGRRLTNDKILASLRRLGVAAQSEVDALRARVEKLEGDLAAAATPRKSKAAAATPSPEGPAQTPST